MPRLTVHHNVAYKRTTTSNAFTVRRKYASVYYLYPIAKLNAIIYLQIARAKAVKAEFIRKAEHQAHEGRKAADILADGVIVGVGLIQRDSGESKH